MSAPLIRRVLEWWDARLGWSGLRATLAARTVPRRDVGSWLGGATLCLALLLVATGVLLMVHYRPSAAEAHASVMRLEGAVAFGALVRGVHCWSAELFVLGLGSYVFSLVARGQHRRGGELVWTVALLGLALGLALALTGSLLPWSRQAHGHARVAGELLAHVPVVGSWLRQGLLGGAQLTPDTLARAFGLHVALLPAAATVLAVVFVVLRRSQRTSAGASDPARAEASMPVHPDLLVRQGALWTGLLLLVALLAIVAPRSAGQAGELSLPAPAGVEPAWYFAAVHQLLSAAPARMLGLSGTAFLVGATTVVVLLLLALPWLDRRGSRTMRIAAWCVLAAWVALTAYGVLT